MKNVLSIALASAAALALSACATTTGSQADTSSSAITQAGPSDAQIAAIVVAANSVDIKNGKLAQQRTQNAQVRELADQMVTDHSQVNQEAVALVTKLGVTPEENDTSRSLTSGGEANVQNLQNLNGTDFDKAYVDNEVKYHQAVLDAVDKTLIPSAKNAELKTLLQNSRPTFVGHLEHAKHVQSFLGQQH